VNLHTTAQKIILLASLADYFYHLFRICSAAIICLYCLNCTKFDQSILRKIIKLFAKQILHFKVVMHQYNFGWGSLTALSQFFSWNLGILLLRERREGK